MSNLESDSSSSSSSSSSSRTSSSSRRSSSSSMPPRRPRRHSSDSFSSSESDAGVEELEDLLAEYTNKVYRLYRHCAYFADPKRQLHDLYETHAAERKQYVACSISLLQEQRAIRERSQRLQSCPNVVRLTVQCEWRYFYHKVGNYFDAGLEPLPLYNADTSEEVRTVKHGTEIYLLIVPLYLDENQLPMYCVWLVDSQREPGESAQVMDGVSPLTPAIKQAVMRFSLRIRGISHDVITHCICPYM